MGDDSFRPVFPGAESPRSVRSKPINRRQLLLRPVDVERLVEEDHPVRAIWELTGQVDLSMFYVRIEAVEGVAGRPVWDPRLLLCLWIYAYQQGISSAREIERLCGYHPGFQWLTGMEVVNHHTLSDFRILHQEALDRFFTDVLGVLSHQGLVTLERVMHDGTKVKACASDKSFRRASTLQDHLRLAGAQVAQMGDPRSEDVSLRATRARERALREKQERLEDALKELEDLAGSRSKSLNKQKAPRASSTDPQARVMLQAKGGYGPSYNVQISTDAKSKVIVGVGVTQAGTDAKELEPAVERVEARLGEKPKQMVVDAGYTNQATIEAMAEEGIDLIGSIPERGNPRWDPLKRRGVSPEFYPQKFKYDAGEDLYTCPGGKVLSYETQEKHGGWIHRRYRARVSDCRTCASQAQCCPGTKKGRSLIDRSLSETQKEFQAKMDTAEALQIFKQRSEVAEFPIAWIKDKIGLRQFRLRGLSKVALEALWACLTYNICQWTRLCWRRKQPAPG